MRTSPLTVWCLEVLRKPNFETHVLEGSCNDFSQLFATRLLHTSPVHSAEVTAALRTPTANPAPRTTTEQMTTATLWH